MALQTSGAISLNDIHVEAGGTTGTQASTNDTDIRGLISKSSGAQMSFSEWYGASSSVSNFQFAYWDGTSNQNNRYLALPKVAASQNGDKVSVIHKSENYGYRHYINGATWDVDTHMALTPANSLFGSQSVSYGWRHNPSWGNRYTSGGGVTVPTDYIPNRNTSSYGGKAIVFYTYLSNYYDYHLGAMQIETNLEGTSTTRGAVDWNWRVTLGDGSPYNFSVSCFGGVCSDNGTPVALTQPVENSHASFVNYLITKFDPSGTGTPYVHSCNPQSVSTRLCKKPIINNNNEIVISSTIFAGTYSGGMHFCKFSGLDWNASSNGLVNTAGRIVSTGTPLYSGAGSNPGSIQTSGPTIMCDSSDNIWVAFLEHDGNGYSNTTNSGTTFYSGVLSILKLNSSLVPQKWYRSLFYPLENYISSTQPQLKLGSLGVINGDHMWLQLVINNADHITDFGHSGSGEDDAAIMLKIKINNPTTATDSNGTYIVPEVQAGHSPSNDYQATDTASDTSGRLVVSNYDNDGSTNKKILWVSNRFRDAAAVYSNTAKLFLVDNNIDSDTSALKFSNDPSWSDTNINFKLYDTALSSLATNATNAVNNSEFTGGGTKTSGGMTHSTGIGAYVFRKSGSSGPNPSQTFDWDSSG